MLTGKTNKRHTDLAKLHVAIWVNLCGIMFEDKKLSGIKTIEVEKKIGADELLSIYLRNIHNCNFKKILVDFFSVKAKHFIPIKVTYL